MSDMYQTKGDLVSISLILLAPASYCINQARTENKVGHKSGIKVKVLAKTSTKSPV